VGSFAWGGVLSTANTMETCHRYVVISCCFNNLFKYSNDFLKIYCYYIDCFEISCFKERCLSGRKGPPAKRLGGCKLASRVRIPPSPPLIPIRTSVMIISQSQGFKFWYCSKTNIHSNVSTDYKVKTFKKINNC
jgi:hypothetical protein